MAQSNAISDPAPALGRGLKLLELLHRQGACSLEQLATDCGWPKSSVLRVLQSLVVAGVVTRDPQTLAYRALMRLVPVNSTERRLKQHCAASMAALGRQCGHTVELHRYDWSGLEMIDRQEPAEAIVRAVARVGWRRSFEELDALMQIACAFGHCRVEWMALESWSKGKRRKITPDRAKRIVTQVRRRGYAVDLGINVHGVRRYAAPILDAKQNLVAVLAIAQACSPHVIQPDPQLAQAVHRTAGRLSSFSI